MKIDKLYPGYQKDVQMDITTSPKTFLHIIITAEVQHVTIISHIKLEHEKLDSNSNNIFKIIYFVSTISQ